MSADVDFTFSVILLDRAARPTKTVSPFPSVDEAREWARWQGLTAARYVVVPNAIPDR